jgi:hypothetical protein
VYISRPTACGGIFEQTAPSLSVKVNALKANGEWVIGPEKVQDVSEGVQKIAVHLKSCCISQQSGYRSASTARRTTKQKSFRSRTSSERRKPLSSRGTLSSWSKKSRKQGPPPPNPRALYFLDDFNGKTLEELGDKWEIIRPDADSYALEKDGLLIINSKAGSLADDNIPNLFRLKTAMPEGDWTATAKFSSEFPAANEMFYLALLQDKENWTAATLVADFHCCPNSSLWIYLS